MTKFFEWQQAHQDYQTNNYNVLTDNVADAVKYIKLWLESGRYQYDEETCYQPRMEWFLNDYPELDPAIVETWLDDPAFDKLLNHSGTQSVIRDIPLIVRKKFQQYAEHKIKLDWTTAEIRVHVQRPGDMFPLHYDRFKNSDFGESPQDNPKITRYLVMLDDKQPGQCFFMGEKSLDWRAGDIITWEHNSLHHGSANFGYYTRYSLRITGKQI
jgi:hypothetical protein